MCLTSKGEKVCISGNGMLSPATSPESTLLDSTSSPGQSSSPRSESFDSQSCQESGIFEEPGSSSSSCGEESPAVHFSPPGVPKAVPRKRQPLPTKSRGSPEGRDAVPSTEKEEKNKCQSCGANSSAFSFLPKERLTGLEVKLEVMRAQLNQIKEEKDGALQAEKEARKQAQRSHCVPVFSPRHVGCVARGIMFLCCPVPPCFVPLSQNKHRMKLRGTGGSSPPAVRRKLRAPLPPPSAPSTAQHRKRRKGEAKCRGWLYIPSSSALSLSSAEFSSWDPKMTTYQRGTLESEVATLRASLQEKSRALEEVQEWLTNSKETEREFSTKCMQLENELESLKKLGAIPRGHDGEARSKSLPHRAHLETNGAVLSNGFMESAEERIERLIAAEEEEGSDARKQRKNENGHAHKTAAELEREVEALQARCDQLLAEVRLASEDRDCAERLLAEAKQQQENEMTDVKRHLHEQKTLIDSLEHQLGVEKDTRINAENRWRTFLSELQRLLGDSVSGNRHCSVGDCSEGGNDGSLEAVILSVAEWKRKIEELQQREHAYQETLKRADQIVADVEERHRLKVQEFKTEEDRLRARLEQVDEQMSALLGQSDLNEAALENIFIRQHEELRLRERVAELESQLENLQEHKLTSESRTRSRVASGRTNVVVISSYDSDSDNSQEQRHNRSPNNSFLPSENKTRIRIECNRETEEFTSDGDDKLRQLEDYATREARLSEELSEVTAEFRAAKTTKTELQDQVRSLQDKVENLEAQLRRQEAAREQSAPEDEGLRGELCADCSQLVKINQSPLKGIIEELGTLCGILLGDTTSLADGDSDISSTSQRSPTPSMLLKKRASTPSRFETFLNKLSLGFWLSFLNCGREGGNNLVEREAESTLALKQEELMASRRYVDTLSHQNAQLQSRLLELRSITSQLEEQLKEAKRGHPVMSRSPISGTSPNPSPVPPPRGVLSHNGVVSSTNETAVVAPPPAPPTKRSFFRLRSSSKDKHGNAKRNSASQVNFECPVPSQRKTSPLPIHPSRVNCIRYPTWFVVKRYPHTTHPCINIITRR
ncbi:unnamed protein product [Cyprideis torosa]|uniref:Uncharacterized protein n=1 Tax=Cyprideis torosa TaxID=163714 RepID=A0A7R8ZL80_9CRUS|nr:unnamed protein product [Cyprideis torosa]CAG0886027.1 unnamed protein product [Cyprideis torosa]